MGTWWLSVDIATFKPVTTGGVRENNVTKIQRLHCLDFIDTSNNNMCTFRQTLFSGTCLTKNFTLKFYSEILNKCEAYPIPLSCYKPQNQTESAKKRITIDKAGRLGNNMYQLAALFSIAARHNMTPVISKRWAISNIFKLHDVLIVDENRPGTGWSKFIEDPDYRYDVRTRYLDSRKDIELNGHFSSYKYTQDVGDHIILDQFQIKDDILAEADRFLRNASIPASVAHYILSDFVYVGIHIRRGDMYQSKYIATPNETFYQLAMNYFAERFPDRVIFVVCSDDIAWSKASIRHDRPVIFSENNNYQVDFAILSRCNHTVRSTGTFGDWAGFLAQGTTFRFNNSYRWDLAGRNEDGTTCRRTDEIEAIFPNVISLY